MCAGCVKVGVMELAAERSGRGRKCMRVQKGQKIADVYPCFRGCLSLFDAESLFDKHPRNLSLFVVTRLNTSSILCLILRLKKVGFYSRETCLQ